MLKWIPVTSIASEYEDNGTTIDKIEAASDFEEDLLWLIAIDSVAHQQDLDAMSAEDVRSFSTARLVLTLSLDVLTGEGDAATTISKMEVQKLDPSQRMNRLGFDEQAKIWVGAMFEVLRDSACRFLSSLLFSLALPSLSGYTQPQGKNGRLPVLADSCLDEYCNIGYMEGIADALDSIRGFNMSCQAAAHCPVPGPQARPAL